MSEVRGGLAASSGEGDAAPYESGADRDVNGAMIDRSDPRPPRTSTGLFAPRNSDDYLDALVLSLVIQHEPITWRRLSFLSGYGMNALTRSVTRLRADGKLIPAGKGPGGLIAVRGG